MQVARESHTKNPNPNAEGGIVESTFDLTLFALRAKGTYELKITSKVVLDFEANKKILPPITQKVHYQDAWAENFKKIVTSKWGRFRLVDRENSAFFMKVTLDCITQTPNTKSSDYHIWIRMHPKFSFAASPQPSFYRGYVWNLRPEDIDDNGNAVHEFGHMIGVTHYNDKSGDRLMYGNDKVKSSETDVEIIKNVNGYVYPEIDLNFHRNWTTKKMKEKKLIKQEVSLWFEPTRIK